MRHSHLIEREFDDEVQFQTMMWSDTFGTIIALAAKGLAMTHLPSKVLSASTRFDDHSADYEVIDRRIQ